MIIKDEDVLKEAIRLITGHKAEEVQVETGNEPNCSFQTDDGTWFVMMVYDLEEEYGTYHGTDFNNKSTVRNPAALKEFWDAHLGTEESE